LKSKKNTPKTHKKIFQNSSFYIVSHTVPSSTAYRAPPMLLCLLQLCA